MNFLTKITIERKRGGQGKRGAGEEGAGEEGAWEERGKFNMKCFLRQK
jgi:hypothetical protein